VPGAPSRSRVRRRPRASRRSSPAARDPGADLKSPVRGRREAAANQRRALFPRLLGAAAAPAGAGAGRGGPPAPPPPPPPPAALPSAVSRPPPPPDSRRRTAARGCDSAQVTGAAGQLPWALTAGRGREAGPGERGREA
jgi:hypothetical protein